MYLSQARQREKRRREAAALQEQQKKRDQEQRAEALRRKTIRQSPARGSRIVNAIAEFEKRNDPAQAETTSLDAVRTKARDGKSRTRWHIADDERCACCDQLTVRYAAQAITTADQRRFEVLVKHACSMRHVAMMFDVTAREMRAAIRATKIMHGVDPDKGKRLKRKSWRRRLSRAQAVTHAEKKVAEWQKKIDAAERRLREWKTRERIARKALAQETETTKGETS